MMFSHCLKIVYQYHKVQRRIPINLGLKLCSSYHVNRKSNARGLTSSVGDNSDHVQIDSGEGTLQINYLWLRENCRCSECYNATTFQKNVDFSQFEADLRPESLDLKDDNLEISWKNGHFSRYSLDWLSQNLYPSKSLSGQKKPWNKSIIESLSLPVTRYEDFISGDEGLRRHLSHLHLYGFGLVTEVKGTHEATMEVCRRVSFPLETFYGSDWVFSSKSMDHEDTAYTSAGIGPHTDMCYQENPAGIQVLHCLHHDGDGGENLLVDGLHLAEKLRVDDPQQFQILSSVDISYEFLGDGHCYRGRHPVITLNKTTNSIESIRYNPYDRKPLNTVPLHQLTDFYSSLRLWTKMMNDHDNQLWIKLKAGSVLFFDNYRVFHGRSAFTGDRVMSGCYLPRDDWLSKARVLGVM